MTFFKAFKFWAIGTFFLILVGTTACSMETAVPLADPNLSTNHISQTPNTATQPISYIPQAKLTTSTPNEHHTQKQLNQEGQEMPDAAQSDPVPVIVDPTADLSALKSADQVAPDVSYESIYNGQIHAPETELNPWLPIDSPLKSTLDDRSPFLYQDILNQFGVETNPRYQKNQQGNNDTYCNIYVWDVTRAMNAEIPHWIDEQGNTTAVHQGQELSANMMIKWLEQYGSQHGWRIVGGEEAQALANLGQPVVATTKGFPGHISMVRPGQYSADEGPDLAQAGGKNFNSGRAIDAFGDDPVVYYAHQ